MAERVSANIANMPHRKMGLTFNAAGVYVGAAGASPVAAIGKDTPSNFGGTAFGRSDHSTDKLIAMGCAGNDNKVGIATDTAATIQLMTWCPPLGKWIADGGATGNSQKAFAANSWDAFDCAEGTLFYLYVTDNVIINAAIGGRNPNGVTKEFIDYAITE